LGTSRLTSRPIPPAGRVNWPITGLRRRSGGRRPGPTGRRRGNGIIRTDRDRRPHRGLEDRSGGFGGPCHDGGIRHIRNDVLLRGFGPRRDGPGERHRRAYPAPSACLRALGERVQGERESHRLSRLCTNVQASAIEVRRPNEILLEGLRTPSIRGEYHHTSGKDGGGRRFPPVPGWDGDGPEPIRAR